MKLFLESFIKCSIPRNAKRNLQSSKKATKPEKELRKARAIRNSPEGTDFGTLERNHMEPHGSTWKHWCKTHRRVTIFTMCWAGAPICGLRFLSERKPLVIGGHEGSYPTCWILLARPIGKNIAELFEREFTKDPHEGIRKGSCERR